MLKKSNKPLKRSVLKKKYSPIKKYSEKGLIKKKEKSENTKKLHKWFEELWQSEPHTSEISGKWLGSENSSAYWHHIIPKSKCRELEFERRNIVRLTLEEHQQVENNPYYFEYVNKKRRLLLNDNTEETNCEI